MEKHETMVQAAKDKLASWKEIADFLKVDVRTAQRWERDHALPVHRPGGSPGHAVFAFPGEIETWLKGRGEHQAESLEEKGAESVGAEADEGTKAGEPAIDPALSVASRTRRRAMKLTFGMLAVIACGLAAVLPIFRTGPAIPQINSVTFTGAEKDYSITLDGKGFGSAPPDLRHLPTIGKTGYFRLGDISCIARGGGCEVGYIRDRLGLNFRSWSSDRISVSGLGIALPGDSIHIGVWNTYAERGAAAAVWGGNIPPIKPGTPQIQKVLFGGSGQDLSITILGQGFGGTPPGLPCTCNTEFLSVGNYAYHNFKTGGSVLFLAGHRNNEMTLVYESWSDTQIRLGGFRGAYGDNGMVVQSGDPIAIDVWSTATGLPTAWGGRVP